MIRGTSSLKFPLVQFAREGEKTLLKPMQWNKKSRKWIEAPDFQTNNPKKKLSIMTYNIWNDTGHLDFRASHVFGYMKEKNPDIIFLQEVNPTFMRRIVDEKWVRSEYQVSDITGVSVIPIPGLMLLTKIPMSNVILNLIDAKKGGPNRFVLIAEMNVNNQKVQFSTVQLEEDVEIRKLQLQKINTLLDKETVFFSGDFNFDPKNEAEQKNVPAGFKDVWDVLKPNESGPTTGINFPENGKTPERFDRILWKGDRWVPKEVHTFGHFMIGANRNIEKVYPTHHLGVMTNFEYTDGSK